MRARVLVTRPEPGASATAGRLADAGFAPVLLPLTAIAPLAVISLQQPADAVAITSANAIRHAPPHLLARLADLPCFAVGAETAQAARAAGVRAVTVGEGDAEALARRVVADTRPGARIAYLAGRVRRDDFERTLASAGRALEIIETYDTRGVAYPSSALASALADGPVDAVLLYSARAAESLAGLPDATRHFGRAVLFGLSPRIAAALPRDWREKLRAPGTPEEDALFRLIDDAFPPAP